MGLKSTANVEASRVGSRVRDFRRPAPAHAADQRERGRREHDRQSRDDGTSAYRLAVCGLPRRDPPLKARRRASPVQTGGGLLSRHRMT